MMITRKISFIMLSGSGNRVKKFSTPVVFVMLIILTMVSGVMYCAAFLSQYPTLQKYVSENQRMAHQIVEQRDEVAQQRLQIQSFAHDIDGLKDKLVKLSQFEKKIRVIANLEPGNNQAALFGIGGTEPGDIAPQSAVRRQHESLTREMHRQVNKLAAISNQQSKNFGEMLNKLKAQRRILASTPSIAPAKGWLSSGFGYRTSPITGGREFHEGVDIANRIGTPIHATADGIVAFVGKENGFGNVIKIDHGHGILTLYGHLSKIKAKLGAKVKRGNIIATMGNTGRSTGPHVHYEVRLNGVPVNPSNYIMELAHRSKKGNAHSSTAPFLGMKSSKPSNP
jgi:murein DD-endopeptidase MepM/ murein hydrolase activator NlpD